MVELRADRAGDRQAEGAPEGAVHGDDGRAAARGEDRVEVRDGGARSGSPDEPRTRSKVACASTSQSATSRRRLLRVKGRSRSSSSSRTPTPLSLMTRSAPSASRSAARAPASVGAYTETRAQLGLEMSRSVLALLRACRLEEGDGEPFGRERRLEQAAKVRRGAVASARDEARAEERDARGARRASVALARASPQRGG